MRFFALLVFILFIFTSPVGADPGESHGTVRVGIFQFEPINFIDKNGEAKGLYPDLIRAIINEEQWSVEFVPGTWAQGLTRLQSGEIDLVTTIAFTPERAAVMDFNKEPVFNIWGQVFLQPGSKIENLPDLEGLQVAITDRDISGQNFVQTIEKFGVNCVIRRYKNHVDVFTALQIGEVSAAVAPNHFGLRHAAEYGLVPSSIEFSPFSVYFATKKGHYGQLLNHIDSHLAVWKADKSSYYYQRLNYWMSGQEFEAKIIPLWLLISLGGILFVALVSILISLIFKAQVKKVTAGLRSSEHEYRKLVERIKNIVLRVDTNGNILFLNHYGLELFGFSVEEILGQNILGTIVPIHEENDKDLERLVKGVLSRPDDFEIVENENVRKDGTRVFIQWHNQADYDETGKLIGVLSVGIDITERKQKDEERVKLETQLHQAQKIESIGQLAGGVAHDFNNMLGVILGHAELALMKSVPGQPVVEDLEEICTAAKHSADLTRQLLTFARKQTISPKILDLNEAIPGIFKMLQRLIGEHINLSWKPAKNLWPVKVDPSQADQILANLCVNARDAITGTGTICIETGHCSFDADYCLDHPFVKPGDFVRLSVSDDGSGMDKVVLEHIFEPFFTTKGPGSGTGLGLATVYGAVKQNAGFINVYSEPGQGTTLNIYFPRVPEPAKAVQEKSFKPAGGGFETVLLVEDDEMLLHLTKSMLEKNGYTVLAAATPEIAQSLVKEHSGAIHLMLSDLIMPEMNGKELSIILRDLQPEMRVIFTSGYTADIISSQGIIEEGIHFLQKPVTYEELMSKVREVLDTD